MILILANTIHFFAGAYIIAYNTLGKINMNLEDVGMTLGVSRLSIIKNVIFPQTLSSVLEMGCYLFVNSMITISAVAFLNTVRTKPLSLMIATFESQMLFESAALVSVVILVVNILMKGIVGIAKSRASKTKA
jgi:iron(III) transport system permease protein